MRHDAPADQLWGYNHQRPLAAPQSFPTAPPLLETKDDHILHCAVADGAAAAEPGGDGDSGCDDNDEKKGETEEDEEEK